MSIRTDARQRAARAAVRSRPAGARALAVPTAERRGGLDPLIDVIAPIVARRPGLRRRRASPPCRRRAAPAASRSRSRASTNTRGEWEPPCAGQRYGAFQAGVQLANRTGALNEIEYSEFVVKAQAFADAVNGAPEFPGDARRGGARARARPVRQRARCAAELRAARAPCGLEPGLRAAERRAPGLRGRHDPGAHGAAGGASRACRRSWGCPSTPRPRWPTIPAQSAIRELTLSLDVPQVDRARAALRAHARSRRRAGARDGRRGHRRRRPAAARRDAWT